MKKVLSVQDLSCLGKCSLTVTLPVLSAMGISCSVLPTAVLSTHTAFPNPHKRSLTEDMVPVCQHWKTIGASFDAIGIGYLSCPEQAAAVDYLLESFSAFTVLDPVMGDHGSLYSGITPAHIDALKQLCKKADVLLPNVTEACLLTGTTYREHADLTFYRRLSDDLKQLGAKNVILTGISPEKGCTGFVTDRGFVYQTVKLPVSCHGTGDLFSAVFTGGCVLGRTPEDAAMLAARFVEQVLSNTPAQTPFGMEFETHLGWLHKQTVKYPT